MPPESAQLLSNQTARNGYRMWRLQAPQAAAHIAPGMSVQLALAGISLSLPVMRVQASTGDLEVMLSPTLAERLADEAMASITVTGLIGPAWAARRTRPRVLLVAEGSGIAPILFLASTLRPTPTLWYPLALIGTRLSLPFTPQPSQILTPELPPPVIAALPLLEDWGIPSRVASELDEPGCFEGSLVNFLRHVAADTNASQREGMEVFVSGSPALCEEVGAVAQEYGLLCAAAVLEEA